MGYISTNRQVAAMYLPTLGTDRGWGMGTINGVSTNRITPKWFIMESPIKMHDFGVLLVPRF